jgi:hypothetical protein
MHMIKIAATIAVAVMAVAPLTSLGANNLQKPPVASSNEKCEDGLGFLRQVYAAQLEAMDENWRVHLYPICEGEFAIPLQSLGNATHLRGTIGRNPHLAAELAEDDYRADDVVAIRIGTNQNVTLFVHHSEY